MKHKITELERRASAGVVIVGTYWQDNQDVIKTSGEVLTRQQWNQKYPDALHYKLRWDK